VAQRNESQMEDNRLKIESGLSEKARQMEVI
jgi:hypothetical protein